MKYILLIITVFLATPVSAMKKKPVKKNYISYLKGTYVHSVSDKKKVGDVYDFTIKTLVNDITIDSVWFGATPVPCDMFDIPGGLKIDHAKQKGTYSVRVNKNLYKNFPDVVDSTEAYKNFKAPFTFKGDAVIMYLYKGKRYYKSVSGVVKVKGKGYR